MSKLGALKKSLDKKDYTTELSEPDQWCSFGFYALNYIATGSFYRGIPNRRVVMNFGESGTGKSLVAGLGVKNMVEQGRRIIYIDTEDAIDPRYLKNLGIDVDDPDVFMPIRLSTIEELSDVVSEIFRTFEKTDKLGIVVDSLGMLDTNDRAEAFDKKGEMKNDMGVLAKKTKAFLRSITAKVGLYDCMFLINGHVYQNQNVLDGRGTHVPSGGSAQIYIPSISLMFKKLKLKEEGAIKGIRMKATTEKTRFFQLGYNVEIEIPYKEIDPYNGVLSILERECDALRKSGAWYTYVNEDTGEEFKFQKSNATQHLDYLMSIMEPTDLREADEGDQEIKEDDAS